MLELLNNPMSSYIGRSKYFMKDMDGTFLEHSSEEVFDRVVSAVYAKDPSLSAAEQAHIALNQREFVPAGRILAGAGTGRSVTLMNCFVSPDIEDSMEGIMESLKTVALTMQQGGGEGMDFSTIRPKGSLVRRTGSISSGVLPFMQM